MLMRIMYIMLNEPEQLKDMVSVSVQDEIVAQRISERGCR